MFYIYIIGEFQVYLWVWCKEWILLHHFPGDYLVVPGHLIKSSSLPQYFEIQHLLFTVLLCLFLEFLIYLTGLVSAYLCQALFFKEALKYTLISDRVHHFTTSSFWDFPYYFCVFFFSIWIFIHFRLLLPGQIIGLFTLRQDRSKSYLIENIH